MQVNTVTQHTVDCHPVHAGFRVDSIRQFASILAGVLLLYSEDGNSAHVRGNDEPTVIQFFIMLKPFNAVCFSHTGCAREIHRAVSSDKRESRADDFGA